MTVDTIVTVKTCRECKLEQPLNNFNIDRKIKDGRRSICRTCMMEARAKAKTSRPTHIQSTSSDIRATANRNALLSLMQRHMAEFDELVKAEQRRLEARLKNPDADKVWIPLT